MKKFLGLLAATLTLMACSANGPYSTSGNASDDILQTLSTAKVAQQPAIIIFGANWCPECRALATALDTGNEAADIVNDFKVVKVDVGHFDTNLDIAAKYGNPIAGGIPGAAILSPDSKLLYVTKPGELTTVRKNKRLHAFFSEVATKAQIN